MVLNANISVSGGTNQVEISAGSEQIDRESPTLGTTVENRRVEGLPLTDVSESGNTPIGVAFKYGRTGSGTGFRVNGSRTL